MTRIRTLEFLPQIFQTETNSQFLGATLDQLVNPPVTKKIQGFIGSKVGYGVDAKDYYVTEPNKVRKDYQLDPGVVFLKDNETTAKDFISYPGILDALQQQGSITKNNSELFASQFYSWDSFTNLDKIINYNQYYWIPEGPPAVSVAASIVYSNDDFIVTPAASSYSIQALGSAEVDNNPTITLLRGGTYNFIAPQGFWIQGEPGTSGYSATQENLYVRDIFGVTGNGADTGIVTFNVPQKDAQDEFNFPGNNTVSVVSTKPFSQLIGSPASAGIDGITFLNLRTVIFFNTGISNEIVNVGGINYNVNDYFWSIRVQAGIITQLLPDGLIPTEQKITALYGNEYAGLNFYKSTAGTIDQVPYLSAPLDTLYYQDSTNENRVGIIKLIENNETNTIDVTNDILGKTNYTSKNGVVFTNGLKVEFDGDVIPRSYLQGEYYVEGVGTGIELISVESLNVPEPFTTKTASPYDILNYDIGPYDEGLNIPTTPDYITIARNSINKNAWSRSNRWFHIDVINATADYNNNPEIATNFALPENKAKRPIIEFYPNLKLFNSGIIGKDNIDFLDNRTENAFDFVEGQQTYYPDVQTYTEYTGTVNSNATPIGLSGILENQYYQIETLGTTEKDTWIELGAELDVDGEFATGTEYIINSLGSTSQEDWSAIAGTNNIFANEIQTDIWYQIIITGNTNWASIGLTGLPTPGAVFKATGAGTGTGKVKRYVEVSALPNSSPYQENEVFTCGAPTGDTIGNGDAFKILFKATGQGYTQNTFVLGYQYTIADIGNTLWNNISVSGTRSWGTGTPAVGGTFIATWDPSLGTTLTVYGTGLATQGNGEVIQKTTTTISIPASDIIEGSFTQGLWINDVKLFNPPLSNGISVLPTGTRILSVNATNPTYQMTVYWPIPSDSIPSNTNVSFVANPKDNADLQLFPGARIVFAKDTNLDVRNKIYVAEFNITGAGNFPAITLTEAVDSPVLADDQFSVKNGFYFEGLSVYFNGEYYSGTVSNFSEAQQKTTVNQAPRFDLFDENGISYGDSIVYPSTTFDGCKLFNYKLGVGINDSVLGFPISYSSINNVGDISFEISLNTQKFDYVSDGNSITSDVKNGFVYDYNSRTEYTRLTGWQTAVANSGQYQVFEFNYVANITPIVLDADETIDYTVILDVPQVDRSETIWPSLLVYNNNTLLELNTDYTVINTDADTTITIKLTKDVDTPIQVLILSNKTSEKAYYSVPINLSNNPFNTDPTVVDIGDIRGAYQSIFQNNPDTVGQVFGANNFRDLGNLVPWNNAIIQNSASLVLPGAFLRDPQYNLSDALLFNSREYIKFKNLLIDTVNQIAAQQKFDPAALLDEAIDIITSVKNEEQPFFWSDMIPSKAPFLSNTYNFANQAETSVFPLSKIYDFTTANYDGVLVYLQRKINGVMVTKQLLRGTEYVVSTDSPSVRVNVFLDAGDKIIVKEYNQTYGSYIPNSPSKLGLYPLYVPKVLLDDTYTEPTYFIQGHDGSYNKLYGDYSSVFGMPVDFRDQALLEYETRVYNNIKLSRSLPIDLALTVPGYFRDTALSYAEYTEIYSKNFLDWVGQNRLDYKTQLYRSTDEYSYNYRESTLKLDNSIVMQGNWRGIYQYVYDTSTPNLTPWAMIGYANKPDWWEDRYGPAPYTNQNLILWTDLQDGIDYNNGTPVVRPLYKRPGLLNIIPVDDQGQLKAPLETLIANYNQLTFKRDWIVGDDAPVEFSYRKSSTYPFDLMRLQSLLKPADFYNLGVDLDNYKYNVEFNQFLVNGRTHLIPNQIQIYGNGTAKTSYINWIVDYTKQLGVNATDLITRLVNNLDVRLVHRLAGFSDKSLLKFFVEKGTPGSNNSSLMIPDESYQVLLYENQPSFKLVYSGVVVQKTVNGYTVFGNSQNSAYFRTLRPIISGPKDKISVQDLSVQVAVDHYETEILVPYGTTYYTISDVSQFLIDYGAWLVSRGAVFDDQIQDVVINWNQMVAEFLYWTQIGFATGSVITLNPSAKKLTIDKENYIVQPLTYNQTNFVLNNNLYPIQNKDLAIDRNSTKFTVKPLNEGDAIGYGQFNLSNIEHGIVFQNETLFNDVIYNLVSGLKQSRIYVRGTKSAEWNGTLFASGFIYNQDNIQEWSGDIKYTKGAIVKYKNKFFTALEIIQPNPKFNQNQWKVTDYDEIQKGLLPNSSTRSFESALYYNSDSANLETDADLLSFSLIGFRPREYMASADLTDITQVNVYKNLIKEKGTSNSVKAFKGANLPQGGIDYDVYENWAILQGTFGGTLNDNFIEFKLNENQLTGNPGIIGLTNGNDVPDAQQLVPLYSLFNYGKPINTPYILPTLATDTPDRVYPNAGYVNINDVKMSAYFYSNLPTATNQNGIVVPLGNLYVNDYVWLADYQSNWQVLTPTSVGQVIQVRSNLNGTCTVTFKEEHNLSQYDIFAIINFDSSANGYFVANTIINPRQILITLTLPGSTKVLTGQGIGLKFGTQRVDQPGDIQSLPLINTEFVKNKVWVDTNNDGSWAVYLKSINYLYGTQYYQTSSVNFGNAVAYDSHMGYLFADSGEGNVYRYSLNIITGEFENTFTITGDASFGTTIVHKDNIYVISQPTTTPSIQIWTLNDSTEVDNPQLYQEILASDHAATTGSTNFGSALALSGDLNWLYISDYDQATPTARNKVHAFRRRNTLTTPGNFIIPTTIDPAIYQITSLSTSYKAGSFVPGETYTIVFVGDTDFTSLGATSNTVGVIFTATGTGTAGETGVAQGEETDFTLIGAVENKVGIYFKATNNGLGNGTGTATRCDYQYMTTINSASTTVDKFGHSISTNYYGTTLVVGAPNVDYSGSIANYGNSYIYDRLVQNIEINQAYDEDTPATFTLIWAPNPSLPLTVTKNGILVNSSLYSVSGTTFTYTGEFTYGDILTIGGNEFVLVQTLTNEKTPRIGVQFGYSLDTNNFGTEILVGAPFYLSETNAEGAVFRYTYGGARFGTIIGIEDVNVTAPSNILINGFLVPVPVGDADIVAAAINAAKITNIVASAVDGKLVLTLANQNLANVNQELLVSAYNPAVLTQLGLKLYTQTQIIQCPHTVGASQFGTTIKFNEFNSAAISAPVGDRYTVTTFDFVDDNINDNDTIFDNNATQFADVFDNAGAVYTFDYLSNYNESLNNIGNYTYGQSVNAKDLVYGAQPTYGYAIDWNEDRIVIGAPGFRPTVIDGQVVTYINDTGEQNWSVFRQSNPVVDINRVENMQIFSAESNNTLINLDYIDPLQGKILGAVRQNIDYVSDIDPAGYNNTTALTPNLVWGADQVGKIWFDTANIRFLNYHQNDNEYNARYWGQLFPGSDIAVCTWVASTVPPVEYQGPGIPKNVAAYTVQTTLNSNNTVVPVYYFWARNTGIIAPNKSLADINIANYISNPQGSGISYLAPLSTNVFALYNCKSYINANDSVLHVGFTTGQENNPAHEQFDLIRSDFADDFLPGVPGSFGVTQPESLYDRFLDSLSGVDESGNSVPDPFLPKAVQSGVLARPRQSFFYDRFAALKNYLQYANIIMRLYPIAEIRSFDFLFESGTYYNTAEFWEYINWWAPGYDDNTRSVLQVPVYADLSTINAVQGTIVTVAKNGLGVSETYRYDGLGTWERIGLENGTIRFKDELYDYDSGGFGFGGTFYDTDSYDVFPSQPTRWIIRALNEQIYTSELLIHRNKSLILMFEYIQEETIENQNYLPWLNKTSLVDVSHKVRELKEIKNFISDNQEFLSGYINETKPYHVVIKEFLFDYTGEDIYPGTITDFDVPSEYDVTINKFVSPQLVYNNQDTDYEFLPDSPVWQKENYKEWYNNYGVALTGQPNYLMGKLLSYVTLVSTSIVVDNAQGFPVNGIIKIGDEQIAYARVNRATGELTGLTRGFNQTQISIHLPKTNVYMDLPAVIVLDTGKNYTNPPRALAYIDTSIYPEPRVQAQLEVTMSLDKVSSITVINPGEGYAVTPEIRIESAESFEFDSGNVNILLHTIDLDAPTFMTGDMVRYKEGTTNIGGLANEQYYYINVLDSTPSTIVALYDTYLNAIEDKNRIQFINQGTGTQIFEIVARALAITSSSPVRENNITIKFDRTSYNSQITEWTPNAFYASEFVGYYLDSTSSTLSLAATQPDINNILSSAGGTVFPVVSVTNNQVQSDWSGLERTVGNISNNYINLSFVSSVGDQYPSGSTVGMTVNMPVKFTQSVTGITAGNTYYVSNVANLTSFSISSTPGGSPLAISGTVSNMKCSTAKVTNTARISTSYPGIRTITGTNATNNTVTVPLNAIGTGGTNGLYLNCPVVFTGDVFGGIEENKIYYVVSVFGLESFSMSENSDSTYTRVYATDAFGNIGVETTNGLEVNDPIVFDTMYINNSPALNFGGISPKTVYYVKEIGVNNTITISTAPGGSTFITSTQVAGAGNYAFITNQNQTVDLTTATGIAAMNISLPVSPGQVDGQKFTFYPSSNNYADITAPKLTYGNLVTKVIEHTLSDNTIALTGNNSQIYNGFSFTVNNSIGNLEPDNVYYTYNVQNIPFTCVISTSSNATFNATFNGFTMTVNSLIGSIYPGTVITGTGIENNTYIEDSLGGGVYTLNKPYLPTTINGITASTGLVTLSSSFTTDSLYEGMPFTFNTGLIFGGLELDTDYYVRHLVNSSTFTISEQKGQGAISLIAGAGSMTASGSASFKAYQNIGELAFGKDYQIKQTGNGNWDSIGSTLVSAGSFVTGQTYIIDTVGDTNFILVGAASNEVDVIFTATGPGTGTGKVYVANFTCNNAAQTGVGQATVLLSDESGSVQMNQEIIADPTFDIGYVLGGYNVLISDGGLGFTQNNTITISGQWLGGTSPTNDLTLTVSRINPIEAGTYSWSLPVTSNGSITKLITEGTPIGTTTDYYLKVINANTFEVYSDPLLQTPVSGLDFAYTGYVTTTATAATASDDRITVTSSSNFNINDPVVFTGSMFSASINLGQVYYIYDKPTSTTVRLTTDPGSVSNLVNITTNASGSMTMAKAGSFMVLPEPFYFNPSIVKYNNRVWLCVVSNNDSEFVFGKWEELSAGDGRLNALDRAEGWYKPDPSNTRAWQQYINMAGNDLTQLFTGLTYPNTTYKGNKFNPDQSYPIDTQLINSSFNATGVDIPAITFNGTNYIAPANLPNYSGVIADIEIQNDWSLYKLADETLSITDITKAGNSYVMTSSNSPIPMFTSTDQMTWRTDTFFVPFGTPSNVVDFFKIKMIAANQSFNAVTFHDGLWIAVNPNIVTSTDLVNWQARLPAATATNILNDVSYVTASGFNGYIVVGRRPTGGIVFRSLNGISWTLVTAPFNKAFNAVTSAFDKIYAVGDQIIAYSSDSTNWTTISQVDIVYNDIHFADGILVLVGNNGVIKRSTDGINFTTVTSGTLENLNSVIYVAEKDQWTIVGNNNTVLQTSDITSPTVVWGTTNVFQEVQTEYTVQGDPFMFGYGPEEMVPGIVSDQLVMTVNTRPGTNWPADQYAHVGYKVVSLELDIEPSNEYDFSSAVQTPAQLSVFLLTDGLSVSLYENVDYEINWHDKIVSLLSPLTSGQQLRIDVYEIGNGNQLVKSNTDNDPIEINLSTGFNEISLDCNYTNLDYNGGGIVQVGTDGEFYTEPAVYHNGQKLTSGFANYVISTNAINNSITIFSAAGLASDQRITFSDTIFGGIVPLTSYYIDQVLSATTITIKDQFGNPVTVDSASGSAIFVTQDYAAMPADNQITAKIVFADQYDQLTDYISYSFFGETEPVQYGYTVPETQQFTGNGTVGPYTLTNSLDGDNPENAIVEVDGLRKTPSEYNVNYTTGTLVFNAPVTSSQTIAVTTFNDTDRQYLFTNTYTGKQVTPIVYVNNTVLPVTVTTTRPHNLSDNDVVRIEDVLGSVQLNGQLFTINVLSATEFALYEYIADIPYTASVPLTDINTYISGGYVSLNQNYVLYNKTGVSSDNEYIFVGKATGLVEGTPVYFTETGIDLGQPISIPELVAGTKYYIKEVIEIDSANDKFSISETRNGVAKTLSVQSGLNVNVTQWEQTNVDRLWVTVKGQRVASSKLRLHEANDVSILEEILPGDEVIITSMMPSSTPDQQTYLQIVDVAGQGNVYRANTETRTWLRENVGEYATAIEVGDATKLTNNVTQTSIAPPSVFGYRTIPLNANRLDVIQVKVYNNTKNQLIDQDYLLLSASGQGAFVSIQDGPWISNNDNLTITSLEGKLLYVNGEYMQILNVDETANIVNVQRGVLGSIISPYIGKYTTVFSLLEYNKMTQPNYNSVWNPIPGIYNETQGDPLQIADTAGADFLKVDVT